MADTVLRADYVLNFQDGGLASATALDKKLRDSVVKTSVAWQSAADIAQKASLKVARAQASAATEVSHSVDVSVKRLAQLKLSYAEITEYMSKYKVSAEEVSAAVVRSSEKQIAAIDREVAARNRLRKVVGMQATSTGRRGGTAVKEEEHGFFRGATSAAGHGLRGATSYVSGGLVGALVGYAGVSGIKDSIDSTIKLEQATQNLTASTGISQKQAAGWIAVAQTRGVTASNLSLAIRNLGTTAETAMGKVNSSSTKALDALGKKAEAAVTGSKSAADAFINLGFSGEQVKAKMNDLPALYDMVTKRLAAMHDGAAKVTDQSELLGASTTVSASTTRNAALAYRELGISQADLQKNSHNMGSLFAVISDRLEKMRPGIEKTSVENTLFGRSYSNLQPILQGGADSLTKASLAAEKMGITMSGSPAKAIQKLQQVQENLGVQTQALEFQFAKNFAPAILELSTKALALGQVLMTKLTPVIKTVGGEAKDVVQWFEKNKVALDALLVTAGGIGALVLLSKGLQTAGKMARGLRLDFETVKTGLHDTYSFLRGDVSKLTGLFSEQQTDEDKTTAATKELTAVLRGLAEQYGLTAEAAGLANKEIAGTALAEGAAAEEGGAGQLSMLGEHASSTGVGDQLSMDVGDSAAIASGASGVAGDAGDAAKLGTAVEGSAASKGIMGALFGAEGASALGSTLMKGAVKGAGIAGVGYIGSSLIGSAIGGKAGQAVSSIGKDASLGAGAGMIIGPEGAVVGGALGAGYGAIKHFLGGPSSEQKQVTSLQDQMSAAAKSGNVALLDKLSKQADSTAQHFRDMSDKVTKSMTRFGQITTTGPDFSKQAADLEKLAKGATDVANATQGSDVSNFTSQLAKIQMPDATNMVAAFSSQFTKASPRVQDAAAKATLAMAAGLQVNGKLPAGAVAKMITQMESQFPGLGSYLKSQGLSSSAEFTSSFDLSKAKTNLSSALTTMETQFNLTRKQMAATGGGMVGDASLVMSNLKTAMVTGSKASRAEAGVEIKGLQTDVAGYMSGMQTNVGTEMTTIASSVQAGSMSAANEGGTAFQGFVTQVNAAMKGGLLSTQAGLKLINGATVAALKALGVNGATASKLASEGWSVKTVASSIASGAHSDPVLPAVHRQAGGWVPGDPYRDGTPALLAGNEFVMTGHGQSMMDAYAPGLLSHIASQQMPHFAKGGFVATPRVEGSGMVVGDVQSAMGLAAATANDLLKNASKLKKAGGVGMSFGAVRGLGGSAGQNESLGREMMIAAGWKAAQWPALQALWTQESGWNSSAVNSSSGAYGIPQALGHGHPYDLGDARAQIAWGLNYIKGRYGSPDAAEAHERANNWYRRGGFVRPLHFRTGTKSLIDGFPIGKTISTAASGSTEKATRHKIPGTGGKGEPKPRYEMLTATQFANLEWAYENSKGGTSAASKVSSHTVPGTGGVGQGAPSYEMVNAKTYARQMWEYRNEVQRAKVKAARAKGIVARGSGISGDPFLNAMDFYSDPTGSSGVSMGIMLRQAIAGAETMRTQTYSDLLTSSSKAAKLSVTGKGKSAKGMSVTYPPVKSPGPSGVAVYANADGSHPSPTPDVAKWIINELMWGRANGWSGNVTSGYRPGPDSHTASGVSEHQGTKWPGGAVDFGGFVDPAAKVTKQALVNLAARKGYPGPRLMMPIGFSDDGHVSGNGHRRGGFINRGRVPRMRTGGRVPTVSSQPLPTAASLGMPTSGSARNLNAALKLMVAQTVSLGTTASVGAIHHTEANVTASLHQLASSTGDAKIRSALVGLKGALTNASTMSYSSLLRIAAQIRAQIKSLPKGDAREKTRLQQALKLTEGAMGERVGAIRLAANNETTAITNSSTALTNLMARKNIDSASAEGTRMLSRYQDAVVKTMGDTVRKLEVAYKAALAAGDKTGASQIKTQLGTALQGLDTAKGAKVQARVAAREAAAQAPVDTATHQVTMAQGRTAKLINRLQMGPVDRTQTAAGGAAIAASYGFKAGPGGTVTATGGGEAAADQKNIGALQKQYKSEEGKKGKKGDKTLAAQTAEAIQQAQAAFQQAQLAALAAIKAGIEAQAQAAVDVAQHTQTMAAGSASQVQAGLQGASAMGGYTTADQTVAGGQQIAAADTGTAQADAGLISALQSQQAAASSVGDSTLASQIAEQIQSTQGDYQAQLLAATQAIAAGVEGQAAAITAMAQHGVNMAEGATANLSASLAGTSAMGGLTTADQTVAGGQQIAASYQAQAAQEQQLIAALTAQAAADSSVGDASDAASIAEAIQQEQGTWQQSMLDATNAIKAGVEGQAQAAVDAATHQENMAQAGQTSLQLQQELAKTSDTPGANAATANYINQSILPALQSELTALQTQLAAAQSVGDATLANQVAEAIAGQQNDILQAQLDAQNAIQSNTAATAVNTENLSGTLGVSFESQTFPDLAGMLNGA